VNSDKDVPNGSTLDGPKVELDLIPLHLRLTRGTVEEFALRKYHTCGQGIDFGDIEKEFGCKKGKSQRVLKRSCDEWFDRHGKHPAILFRSPIRTSPQKFYPTIVRADIMERLKRKNVLIDPTEVPSSQIKPFSVSKHPLSNLVEYSRANTFLEALLLIPYPPLFIHNLHLEVNINQKEYELASSKQEGRDRYKSYFDRIGKINGIQNVQFIVYPKGKVMIFASCSENAFKLETDNDVSYFFSFLGQVRDRMLLWLNDVRETVVPSIMEWRLHQCDLNRDVEITDHAQITLPDIQLKHMDRVFRLYVKSLHDRAVYRHEEFISLNLLLPEAIDNIRHPFKSLESKIDELLSKSKTD
jgi:hypothetical protein